MMRVRQTLLALPAVVAAVLVGLPVAASADTGGPAADASGQHCVVQLRPADENTPSTVTSERCFGTFAGAVTFATGVRLPANASAASAARTLERAVDAATASPMASRILGIEYKNSNFSGGSFTFTGSSACTGGTHYDIANTHQYGFGDNISSARTYSNCAGVHFEDKNFGGDSLYVYGSQANFGSMNDKTSSIRFS